MKFYYLLISLILIAPNFIFSHALNHTVKKGVSVIEIKLNYVDGEPYSYEPYKIFAPDNEIPFQRGNTDRDGHLYFKPDKIGKWKILTLSETGHNKKVEIEITSLKKNEESDFFTMFFYSIPGLILGSLITLLIFKLNGTLA